MADSPAATSSNVAGEPGMDIVPFEVQIPRRYLDITRKKLELARLPDEPDSSLWWTPKPQIESLVDFWLDKYSWEKHEAMLNKTLPQFRTGFQTSTIKSPVLIHFIHVCSPHLSAVPLLLIPPFPLTNLTMGHLIPLLTNPGEAGKTQPFHVVIPSLPGLGFSDALPEGAPPVPTTAGMFDALMKRLGYPHYVATNSGSSSMSPAEIDWRIIKYLANRRSDSCLGVHVICPPLKPPQPRDTMEWSRWTLARWFKAEMLGYSKDDFEARSRLAKNHDEKMLDDGQKTKQLGNTDCEPNTPAYALCDSPVGALVYAMKVMRTLGPKRQLSPEHLISITNLFWLPGPEAALRYWASCATKVDDTEAFRPVRKPKMALTVFLGEAESEPQPLPRPANIAYVCPRWASSDYEVVHINRVPGKPGVLSLDHPRIIAQGAQGLAKTILKKDGRMQRWVSDAGVLSEPLHFSNPVRTRTASQISDTTLHEPLTPPPETPPLTPKSVYPETSWQEDLKWHPAAQRGKTELKMAAPAPWKRVTWPEKMDPDRFQLEMAPRTRPDRRGNSKMTREPARTLADEYQALVAQPTALSVPNELAY